jgi:hypothetical protein
MTDFIFNPRTNYPFILTNSLEGNVLISGVSIPENPNQFYLPLLSWVDDYLSNQSNALTVNFELQYFGNTSSKAFFDLFQIIQKHYKVGKKIIINWFYYPYDDDIKEDGEEYKTFFELPFNIIEVQPAINFHKKKTENSPLVYFDQSGDVIIEGNSTSKEPWEYFFPLIRWIDVFRFRTEGIQISVEINLSKIDKTNLIYINHILKELELVSNSENKNVVILWKFINHEIMDIGIDCLNKLKLDYKILPV